MNLIGLRLPVRETTIVIVVIVVLAIDYYHDLLPVADPVLRQGLDRALLFLLVPLLALVLLREHPSDYGLRIGEWRVGLTVVLASIAVMTPVIWIAASIPAIHDWYRSAEGARVPMVLGLFADAMSAEFLFRGFLLLAMVRAIGPLGIIVALLPFTLAHLGKPELETLSSIVGGTALGWLVWRTRSIVYGGLIHTWILVLVVVAASAR